MSRDTGIVGRPVDEAVDAIRDRDPDLDADRVREALDPVVEDGAVTETGIEGAVSDTSKLIATAETRTELASIAYEDATETAAEVADLDVVADRLTRFEARLESVESRAADLGAALPSSVDVDADAEADPLAIYEMAVDLREVASRAQGVVKTADDLQFDLEQFESWVERPNRRYDEFEGDLDLLGESLDDLSAAIDRLPDASETPARDWADATMRVAVTRLLLADLRAELETLRTWAESDGEDVRDGLGTRLADLETRCDDLADDLDALARPAWRDRFEDDVDALAADLDAFDPPVEWATVQQTLQTHRERAFDDAA